MEMKFTDENFEAEVLKSDIPVLVDFFAEWCVPCKMMGPAVEQLSQEYDGKVKIGKINVDENQTMAGKFGIMSIPTMMIFKNGEMVSKEVGQQTKTRLQELLDAAL